MKPLVFSLWVLLCGALAAQPPQGTSDRAMARADKRERILAARITSPSQVRPAKRVDVAQVKRDAEEFARLEMAIRAQIAEAERGMVPKDLGQNLKKIQKLSKRLRADLSL